MKPRKATSSVIAGIRAKTSRPTPEFGIDAHQRLDVLLDRLGGREEPLDRGRELADQRVQRQGQADGQAEVADVRAGRAGASGPGRSVSRRASASGGPRMNDEVAEHHPRRAASRVAERPASGTRPG